MAISIMKQPILMEVECGERTEEIMVMEQMVWTSIETMDTNGELIIKARLQTRAVKHIAVYQLSPSKKPERWLG